ncbi:MAG: TadE/TadG family type IV pilus assembly protein [Dehalococcoidia bacterium]
MRRCRVCFREGGQAVVEFAAIMLPLAILFVLALDGALFFFGYVTAAHATREGARCGTVGGSTANIQTKVLGELPGSSKSVTVSRTDVNGDGVGIGDRITVSATWTYNWVTPLSLFGLSDGTTKTYTADMRLETDKIDRACT